MKCLKCGYDYPAKDTKCPYCGEPNQLGMRWQQEEEDKRKDTLLTKARVLHSMPLYVVSNILNIILLITVVSFLLCIAYLAIEAAITLKYDEYHKKKASVEQAEQLYAKDDNAALNAYLHDYNIYAEDGYEKYTERVNIYTQYERILERAMEVRELSDWEKNKQPDNYVVRSILENARDLLLQDGYRLYDIQFEENEQYCRSIQQDVTALLMGEFALAEEEVEDLLLQPYSAELISKYAKLIYERKGWEYEEE